MVSSPFPVGLSLLDSLASTAESSARPTRLRHLWGLCTKNWVENTPNEASSRGSAPVVNLCAPHAFRLEMMGRLPERACLWAWVRAWRFPTHSSSTVGCSCSSFSAATRPVSETKNVLVRTQHETHFAFRSVFFRWALEGPTVQRSCMWTSATYVLWGKIGPRPWDLGRGVAVGRSRLCRVPWNCIVPRGLTSTFRR